MRRRIIIGLAVYAGLFIVLGVYIIFTIENATFKLDNLIRLHQVEILREHFLIQIKRVQSDLALKNTPYSRNFDTMVTHVMTMGRVVDTCFDCHHTPVVMARLSDLKAQTDRYKDALSRVLTTRANAERMGREESEAFEIGEGLTAQVGSMIAMTSRKLEEKTGKAFAEISNTKYILFFLLGAGPFLSLGLVFLFSKGFTKPVGELLAATRKLKAGDLDYRIEGLKDEFGELGASFNEMAGSLKEQMTRLQRTEQMVVAAELAAGLAHEIKNPLAGIKVAMNVLSQEATLSEEDRGVLGKVIGEVSRVEALLKSFLNFTKPPKPQFAAIQVNNLLNTTLAFYLKHHSLPPGQPNRIEIVKDLQPLPTTKADPMQLQQVVLNIVLNAIHAMPAGGTLTIRTAHDADRDAIRIEISDTGKGIKPELIENIFQPFFTTKAKGTGLGLAISKQLVEQHGGTIGAANNPGGGSTFSIQLPVTPVEEGLAV